VLGERGEWGMGTYGTGYGICNLRHGDLSSCRTCLQLFVLAMVSNIAPLPPDEEGASLLFSKV
jgi:hypothetical protein